MLAHAPQGLRIALRNARIDSTSAALKMKGTPSALPEIAEAPASSSSLPGRRVTVAPIGRGDIISPQQCASTAPSPGASRFRTAPPSKLSSSLSTLGTNGDTRTSLMTCSRTATFAGADRPGNSATKTRSVGPGAPPTIRGFRRIQIVVRPSTGPVCTLRTTVSAGSRSQGCMVELTNVAAMTSALNCGSPLG